MKVLCRIYITVIIKFSINTGFQMCCLVKCLAEPSMLFKWDGLDITLSPTTLSYVDQVEGGRMGSWLLWHSTLSEFCFCFSLQLWTDILPMTELRPGYPSTAHNFFCINNSQRWTHLRLNIYPGTFFVFITGSCHYDVILKVIKNIIWGCM